MCRADGCESPDVSSHRHATARKEHRCNECSRTINAGEAYRSIFSVYEGDAYTHKTCAHCQVATQWLAENCGGWLFDEVRDEILEHAAEYPDLAKPLSALADGIKECWRDAFGALLPVPEMPPKIPVLVEAH